LAPPRKSNYGWRALRTIQPEERNELSVALRPPRRQLDRHVLRDAFRAPATELRTCTIIADEHRAFREGVRSHLGFGFDAAGEAASVSELARMVAANPAVDLVLISATLPGGGLAAAVDVIPTRARFVVFGAERREAELFEALELGASGYLLKNIRATELATAMRSVVEGERVLDPSFSGALTEQIAARGLAHRLRLPTGERVTLTARENEVAKRLRAGQSTQSIAEDLGISSITVRRHISVLMRKLQVTSRAGVLALLGD
jgi:two-component system nitrate/nitrite response regulator NarL